PRYRGQLSGVKAYGAFVSPQTSRVPEFSGYRDWTRHYESLTYPAIAGVSARPGRPWGEPVVSETNDVSALTAVVLREEEVRRDAQAQAEAGEVLPDDLLPGVGGAPMPLRDGWRTGCVARIVSLLLVAMIETFDQVAVQVLPPDIQKSLGV